MKRIQTEIMNTTEQVRDLVDWLVQRRASENSYKPAMYIDLEGINLGSLSISTLLIDIQECRAYLSALSQHCWLQTNDAKGCQDAKNSKVFFDACNDSDSLFTHLDVALQGVERALRGPQNG